MEEAVAQRTFEQRVEEALYEYVVKYGATHKVRELYGRDAGSEPLGAWSRVRRCE